MTQRHRIETWVWILIYGGLLGVSLGLFARQRDAATGWSLVAGGAAACAAGIGLIWLRSRMKD